MSACDKLPNALLEWPRYHLTDEPEVHQWSGNDNVLVLILTKTLIEIKANGVVWTGNLEGFLLWRLLFGLNGSEGLQD